MYTELARQLGYRTKLATRARAAYALFNLVPQTQSPLLREIQSATGHALTGAFAAETVADLLQQEDLRGQAAVAGALTGLGRYAGGQYLTPRLFPGVHEAAISKILRVLPEQKERLERALRAGGRAFTPKQVSAGRGLGTLAGLAAGLLAAYGIGHLKSKKPEDQK